MINFIRASFSKDKKLYFSIKNILGFYPKNIFLYKLAFKHKSVVSKKAGFKRNNERLEYLGDSVLSTSVAYFLFKKYPTQAEGFLTEMRSKIVSRASLNKLAKKMRINKLVDINPHGNSIFKSADGDAFEALIGAIFLDKGYDFAQKVIIERIIKVHLDIDEIEYREWNYKSKLIDWGQKNKKKVNFEIVQTLQEGHKKEYTVEVFIEGQPRGRGVEHSIKSAEQLAAEKGYKDFVEPLILQELDENDIK